MVEFAINYLFVADIKCVVVVVVNILFCQGRFFECPCDRYSNGVMMFLTVI